MKQSLKTVGAANRDPQSTDAWRAVEEGFWATGDASPVQSALTSSRDELVVEAYRTVVAPVCAQSVAALAGGAYGQGQTYPYSELDIILLLESEKQSDALKEILPEFVRLLWNAGLRLNPAVLTVAECLDAVERGSVAAFNLLDRRFLTGDALVHANLEERLPEALSLHGHKMSQHLCELARARHARYQHTAHHAEPDVKQGPGGLQDVRLVDWLGMLGSEHRPPDEELKQAAALVSTARCFLHYHAGCDHNILDFEAQENLARQPFAKGRTPAEWMREYFRSARLILNRARRELEKTEKSQSSLLESFREYRSRLSNQEFTVSRERLLLRHPAQLASDPALILRMLEFVARHGVWAAAETEMRLEASRESFAAYCAQPQPLWNEIRSILGGPHAPMALRVLEVAGLLPALFPEWAAIEDLVSPGAEYRCTVDEHTLRTAERVLELRSAGAEQQRFQAILSEIDDVALVLFALLFHEIGMEAAGAAMARIQMPEDCRATVEFLIGHQSDLSEAVSGRDMDDPATARLLADRAGTSEHLKLLSILTYSRIMAAEPDDKTAWHLEQLWHAYSVAQRELIRELQTERIQEAPAHLSGNPEFLKGLPQRFLRSHSEAEIQRYLQLFEASRPTGVAVRLEPLEGAYRLTIVARDKPFLFASFAAAISSFGMDILKAEASSNAASVILDTFVFADPKRMLQQNPGEADRLTDMIQRIALGKTDAQRLMRGRTLPDPGKRPTAAAPHVQFDSEACPTATLVEIETEDRPGLLYSLATVFSSNACNIDVVLVDTKGHRAIDVFYVAHDGRKLPPEMQERLKEKLVAAC